MSNAEQWFITMDDELAVSGRSLRELGLSGGDATTCRACAADKIAAQHRLSADAYIAVNATGVIHK